jgi:hypothetical protein
MTKSKVFIPNRSIHDFSAAEVYGEIVFLSEGNIRKYATNILYREFYEILKTSDPTDYILISGLTVLNVIATLIMQRLHGRVNLLLFKPGRGGKKHYVERVIA